MWQLLFGSNFYSKSEFCERKIVSTDNWTAQLAETIAMYLLLNFVELHTMWLQNTADLHSILKQHVKQWIMGSDLSSPVLALSQISLPVTQCALHERRWKRQGQNWIRCMVVSGMVKSIVNRKRMWSKLTCPNHSCDKCLQSNSQLYMLDIFWW